MNAGQWNYDEIRFEYYRDETVAFESFKAGNLDYWQETSAKNWATAYDFAAVRNGYIKRQEVPVERTQPMQCFVLNLRRPQFAGPPRAPSLQSRLRLRVGQQEFVLWPICAGRQLLPGQRAGRAARAARGRELEILNEVKDGVPPEVFTEVHKNPVNDNPDDMRGNLRKAVKLLKEAGWEVKNGVLTNVKTGQTMKVEFLLVSPLFERIVQPYLRNLERLGIKGTHPHGRLGAIYRRLNVFDYDIVVGNFAQSDSPGNEQRDFWGSEAADREGSRT